MSIRSPGEEERAGDAERGGVDDLFNATFDELRRLATSVRRGDSNRTLNPTALVHEAWIKLASAPPTGELSPLHFKRIAARAMRQVLVDAARRRLADKRGGGLTPITFDEGLSQELRQSDAGPEELLHLDGALAELARLNPRQAAVVECRYFGGLEVAETAQALSISEATVLRDWRVARAWLARSLASEE